MKNSFIDYCNIFTNWRKELLSRSNSSFRVKGCKGGIYTVPREEIESSIPCFTEDINSKFYRARTELPKFWFISKGGYLFSSWSGTVRVVKPLLRSYNNDREGYTFGKHKFDPAILTCLCFEGNAYPKAQEMLEAHGLLAFNKSLFGDDAICLHHIYGYKYGKKSPKETRSYNCDLKNTIFVTDLVHNTISHMKRAKGDEIIERQMKRIAQYSSPINITVIRGNEKGAGNIIECNSLPSSILSYIINEADRVSIQFGAPLLIDVKGKEIIRGVDVPTDFYDESMSIYKDYLAKTCNYSEPFFVSKYKGSKIFGDLKSA